MNLALALLLSCAAPAQSVPPPNLDFHTGTLDGWEGSGFHLAPGNARGPTLQFGVTSGDPDKKDNTGVLHLTLHLPENAGVIRFRGHVVRGKDQEPESNLDVILTTAKQRLIPKKVKVGEEWKPAGRLQPPKNGKPREYLWDVAAYAGQVVRLVLVDEDPRPGCHLFCGGFRIIPADEFDGQEFSKFMLKLVQSNKLAPMARYESKHFVALSNADEAFSELRLNNCELFYDIFFDFFRRKGFPLREPPGKMMVAIFDAQAGFEAYLGQKMPATVTGVYHTGTNRLLVYDYGRNDSFVAQRRQSQQAAKRIGSDMHRRQFIETANRRAQEFRTEANIGTIMHEAAHQLSFNSGMLNRDSDVPFWVAEGLACYCEATHNNSWQGIGEMNEERMDALVASQGKLVPLRDLITRDDWLEQKPRMPNPLLVYAQSWALFHMLMTERPQEMRYYLALIYPRRTGERREADFQQAFGSDQKRFELRYGEYIKELVERYRRTRR